MEPQPVDTSPRTDTDVPQAENSQIEKDTKRSHTMELNPDFAVEVSDFIKKLAPISHFFPPKLAIDMQNLGSTVHNILREETPPEGDSMQDWTKSFNYFESTPMPIIQAFYHHRPGTTASTANASAEMNTKADGERGANPDFVGDQKNLQRILISSNTLRSELESITSISLSHGPLIVAPPYKLLLGFLPEMRLRLTQICKKLREMNDSQQGNENFNDEGRIKARAEGTKDQDTKSYGDEIKDNNLEVGKKGHSDLASHSEYEDLSMRVSHLQCLYDFIREELGELIELRAHVGDGSLESIKFEDLWHLIQPGDVIVSAGYGYDQLYKVYSVTGGQIRRRPRTSGEITEMKEHSRALSFRPPRPSTMNRFDENWTDCSMSGHEEDDETGRQSREEASDIGTWTPLKVDCYSMAFDGTYIGPVEKCKKIEYFIGERRIHDLPVYPVRFHPQKDKLLRQMEDRGRRFVSSHGHKSYQGKVGTWRRQESRDEVQSDVYIDIDLYYQRYSHNKPDIGRLLRSRQDLSEVEEKMPDETVPWRHLSGHRVDQKLAEEFIISHRTFLEKRKAADLETRPHDLRLMPYQVIGYVFRLRKWCLLDVDLIRDIDEDSSDTAKSAFEDLVIPERYRKLLVALIENHASGLQRREHRLKSGFPAVTNQIDLIRGKGQGLIILLHGPPGSGKTSTAESIAAYTKRPLYSITCGDIGLKPETVETRLRLHFARADKWGCILLLDEADVFLMQRNWADMQRNALVSVFLRQLEYYPGILFLTTNRPGVLDEAFKSRIHIALKYPKIDLESTKKMWTNIMNRFERENKAATIKIQFDRESLLAFAESHFQSCQTEGLEWNGRQIRNAFQTALALGHYDRTTKLRENHITEEQAAASGKRKWMTVKITKANFRNIAKTARDFEDYIDLLRGKDSDLARQAELRDDDYDPGAPRARKEYPNMPRGKTPMNQGRSVASSSKTNAVRSRRTAYMELDDEDVEDDENDEDDDEDEDGSENTDN
ncbi:MAG: hypothetical protein Q9165_006339 [Trypethelium subeluteriae]